MVSVRTTDNAVSRDPDDVIQACDADSVPKLCIGAIDKKVRNLEKRKTKLDGYKQKIAGGEKLAKEQMDALEKYDLVNQNLEFARELQKQIQGIAAGTENGRSEESWSMKMGVSGTLGLQEAQEILMLQSVLRIVQSKQTHLLNGVNLLTEEETTSLVEFGNLISTSDDISEDCIQMAAGHLCKYMRKDSSEVIGTTYEKIYDAVNKIVNNVRALSYPRSNSQMSSIENSMSDLKISNDKSTSSEVTTDSSNGEASPPAGGSAVDPRNKPLQDILKGMEGEFTFLQESEIYKEISEQPVELPQVEPPMPNIPTTTDACVPDVNQTSFHMNAHPIENAVFVPKYVTIPLTNTIYAPTNTLPVTHQYAPVPAFTSYDYTIQNPLSFPAVYHHAIINGTTYFQPGAQMYTTRQAPADPYSQMDEYPEAAEAGTAEEVYYPPQYEVPIQQTTFQTQPEEQENENFELPTVPCPEHLPMPTTSHFQQPEDVPSTSPQPPRQNWQFGRGRGGRGSYRGQRNFQNQYRYQRNRPENDQAGGYRGHPRSHRYNNTNAFQKQE